MIRDAILEACGLKRTASLAWWLTANGGTQGWLSEAAHLSAAETALFLASENDFVFLTEIGLRRYKAEYWRSRPMPRIVYGTPQSNFLVEQEIDCFIVNPSSLARKSIWEKVRVVPHGIDDGASWENKITMHKRLYAAGIPRPASWVISGPHSPPLLQCGESYVIKGDGRPILSDARKARRILLDALPYHSLLLERSIGRDPTINIQFVVGPGVMRRVLASLQLTSLSARGELFHCGNLIPPYGFAQARWDPYKFVARNAATTIRDYGYCGLVGFDIVEDPDVGPVVCDVNARLNASSFLAALEPSEFWRGFIFGIFEGTSVQFERTISTISDHRFRVEQCFTPIAINGRIAFSVLIESSSESQLIDAFKSLNYSEAFNFPCSVKEIETGVERLL